LIFAVSVGNTSLEIINKIRSHHDIAEILLMLALSINQSINIGNT
jgi:hypothetical protein